MWKTFIGFTTLFLVSTPLFAIPDGESTVVVVGGYEVGTWYQSIYPEFTDIRYRLTKDPAENIETFNMRGSVNAGISNVLPIVAEISTYAHRTRSRYRPSNLPETTILRSYSDVPSIRFLQSKILREPLSFEHVNVQIVRHVNDLPYIGRWTDTILFVFPSAPTATDEGALTAQLHWIQFDEESFEQIGGSWKETCEITLDDEDLFHNNGADLYGYWHLSRREDGGTNIAYLSHIDPGFAGRQFKNDLVRRVMPDMPKWIMVVREALGLIPDTTADTGR